PVTPPDPIDEALRLAFIDGFAVAEEPALQALSEEEDEQRRDRGSQRRNGSHHERRQPEDEACRDPFPEADHSEREHRQDLEQHCRSRFYPGSPTIARSRCTPSRVPSTTT